jgi:N-acetyl-alpha-D-muramate 1-phosphate uridylyltransferase
MINAMLLAAGRGERMRPLSDSIPKPLLKVQGRSLIEWQILALARAGIKRIVINHAWLGRQIEEALGQGLSFGLQIVWSPEHQALGTAGGVVNALSKLEGDIFLVASADIFTDFDYQTLNPFLSLNQNQDLAHLVMVDDQRVKQDFDLDEGRVCLSEAPSLTYGNIGLFHRALFEGLIPGQDADLGKLLRRSVEHNKVSGQQHTGHWDNVGTPDDLSRVNKLAFSSS